MLWCMLKLLDAPLLGMEGALSVRFKVLVPDRATDYCLPKGFSVIPGWLCFFR